MLKTFAATLALSMFMVMGCSKETDPAKTPGSKTTPAEDNTFKLELPTGATNVAKGNAEAVKIGVDRGDNVTGPVSLTFKPPAGVTVDPTTAEILADQDDVEVNVNVAADTALGEKSIPVTGKAGGKEASGSFKVEVTEP